MRDLHGCYLLISLGCMCYVSSLLVDHLIKTDRLPNFDGWTKIIVLCFTTFALWKFDGSYRHHYSEEAIGHKEICAIMADWEDGSEGKKRVIERLNHLEGNSKPWVFYEGDEDLNERDPLFGY